MNQTSKPESETNSSPEWTTGQAIGFLIALPGVLTIIGAAGFAMIIAGDDNDDTVLIGLLSSGGAAVVGVFAVVIGWIVFRKCEQP